MADEENTTTTGDTATDDTAAGTDADQETSATDDTSGPDTELGDAGKKALAEERKGRREAEKRAKDLERQLRATEKGKAGTETEAEQAAAKATAADERATKMTARAVRAEVRALAADGFADPDDAAAFLELGSYADDDGEIDTQAIKDDLTDLLKRKPHLAKRKGPKPDPSQGARGGGAPSLDQQIADAEKAGDSRLAISLKNQKLLTTSK